MNCCSSNAIYTYEGGIRVKVVSGWYQILLSMLNTIP